MPTIKKEMSVVGGIAPSGMDTFATKNNPTTVRKKKLNNKKNTNSQTRRIKERVNSIMRNVIYEAIVDQQNPQSSTDNILKVWDNLAKQIEMSIRYSRVFIADGLKVGDNALKFSMRRAYIELDRIKTLSEDMQALIKKVHSVHLQQTAAEQQQDAPTMEMPKESTVKKEGAVKVKKKSSIKKEDNSSSTSHERQDVSSITVTEPRKLKDDEGVIEDPTILDEKY